jgi:hypothetical protein
MSDRNLYEIVRKIDLPRETSSWDAMGVVGCNKEGISKSGIFDFGEAQI